MNPDFELYDNVGRTSEQIDAARYGRATSNDLYRWARHDSEDFRSRHPLPDEPFPVPDLALCRRALEAADNPAEFSAALTAVLDAVEPFLTEVSEHLVAAARWKDGLRGAQRGSPPRLLQGAASSLLGVLAVAGEADLMLLRAEYDPTPSTDATRQRPSAPRAAPPPPPGPQPPGGPARR
ncbi:hypothetical protein ACFRI7_11745 [Streptomyces sp. NPDC056716]|uniref:hypothetical protein n=1 Tax=unclassified Streptomyces TaxID=2593676 RepID=UPI0036B46FBA